MTKPASSTLVEKLLDPRFVGQEGMRSEAAARITELEERSEAQKAQVKWGSETIERLQSQLERVRAETIEECAKVAENFDLWSQFEGDFEGNCIAAAIRSLPAPPQQKHHD